MNRNMALKQAAQRDLDKRRNKRGLSNFARQPKPANFLTKFKRQQSY